MLFRIQFKKWNKLTLLDSMKGVLCNYQKFNKTNGIICNNESLDIFLSDIYQELNYSES